MLIKPNKVFNFAKSFLKKLNLGEKKSSRIAELLVKSDMSNHFSHGVIRLIQYHNMVKDKIYKPRNDPSAKKKGSLLLVDGNRAFGQVSMHFACEKIKKINKEIQVTSVINTGHIGRLSDYSENLSKAGFINLIFCNGGGPNTSIYPSRERLVGTNPFSAGIPIGYKRDFIVDFATSMLAEGKINLARLNKKKLTNKPIINQKGIFSNNAAELYSGGSLATFGGIKGSAFCLLNEILGGQMISNNNPTDKNYLDGNNCLIITIKKKLFNYNKSFKKQFLNIEKKIKNSKKIGKIKKTYLPGEIEKENYKISKLKGINYNKLIIKKLNHFAKNELNLSKNLLI